MIALVKTKIGKGLSIVEMDNPTPGFGEVLVKVVATGICGSDVHVYQWTPGYEWMESRMPLILGHEVVGTVTGVGDGVTSLKIGDNVVCLPGIGCGECELCKKGKIAICKKKELIGLHKNGSFAEYVTLPESACYNVGAPPDLNVFALAEPLTVSARAVKRAGNLFGKNVAVMGAGVIGLGVAYFASRAHARVWMFGKDNDVEKFEIAKLLEIDGCLNVDQENLDDLWQKVTNKKGFDVVFDCTGVSSLIQDCINMTKIAGRIVALGIYSSPVRIDLSGMVRQEKELITSYGYTREIFEGVVKKISDSPQVYRKFITHTLNLRDGLEAIELASTGKTGKILLIP